MHHLKECLPVVLVCNCWSKHVLGGEWWGKICSETLFSFPSLCLCGDWTWAQWGRGGRGGFPAQDTSHLSKQTCMSPLLRKHNKVRLRFALACAAAELPAQLAALIVWEPPPGVTCSICCPLAAAGTESRARTGFLSRTVCVCVEGAQVCDCEGHHTLGDKLPDGAGGALSLACSSPSEIQSNFS